MLASGGTPLAHVRRMAPDSLADRVAALEVKVGTQTIQEQFQGQAELIDRLFVLRFDEHDKEWEARLETKLAPIRTDIAHLKVDVAGLKLDVAGLKSDVAGLKVDVAALKTDVAALKTDLAVLKTDLATVKDDVKKILSHLRKRR